MFLQKVPFILFQGVFDISVYWAEFYMVARDASY